MTDWAVDLSNLSRTWPGPQGTVRALSLRALQVARGERLAVVGANGSGKTTLLHLIAGMVRPVEGKLAVLGRDLRAMSESDLDRFRATQIGYLPHGTQLMESLTALENVMLSLWFSGAPHREHRTRAMGMLEHFGVAHRALHLPTRLSAGERQRVALARAWVHRPALLLADEPSSNLDPETSAFVAAELARFSAEEGRTLLLVTHNLQEIGEGWRILRLRGGEEVVDE